ncbi:unnamed protein product [Macrosiphum euphorbiae]|uniref:Uncharacterized protein n=1 Tax=Macrosiphum euphorbiae TaxID=13131 RepID=A0AAV0XL69_9HEMI|nr:unnamed protein product [Macrosiphum euphorbiae]
MKYTTYILAALLLVTLWSTDVDSRRVNVKPAASDDVQQDDAQAAADDEQQQQQFKPVLIARRPLQHRPQVDIEAERQPVVVVRQTPRVLQQRAREQQQEAAADEEDEQPQVIIRQQHQPTKAGPRSQSPHNQQLIQQRLKQQEQPQQQKEPTAQTIRNFNKLNDDGSFTFGYEADDGSFKEETRGTDCVVRGKYGYVDPDGNKREFTYVQGNPCDPNAVNSEEDDDQPGKPSEKENIPANIPVNAGRPKPKKNRPTTTLFQQTFGDFEPQPQSQPSTTPRQPGRQQMQQPSFQESPRRPPPQILSSTTAAPPQQFISGAGNLDSAIRNLPQPSSPSGKVQLQSPTGPNSALYTTELVFDPATGQYNTVIFQQVPKQQAGININQRLPLQGATAPARQQQPLPQQQQFRPQAQPQFQQPQFQQPQPQFRPAVQPFQPQFQQQRPAEFDFQRPAAAFPGAPGPQQQLVQQQQAMAFQQSQNLFRQQQQKQQQQQQSFQPQSSPQFFPPPSQRFEPASQFAAKQPQRFEQQPEAHQQQFVLVQPGRTPGQQSLAAGQIDAFLRGHNVQF